MNDRLLELLGPALGRLQDEFAALPEPRLMPPGMGRAAEVLTEAAGRLGDNYPYFHPLYAGQMLKPPHPVAQAAYALAMTLNPNNHALDGGRASSRMEVEAVREIAAMFGWSEFLGHLTSGGTFANLEALWVAGQMAPGKKVVASEQAHYTHGRISGVLQLPFAAVRADDRGRMDLEALETALQAGDVGTVVATLGTTAVGAVDPLDGILELRSKYGFRVHVDAAYGGYFRLASNLGEEARRAFERAGEADSIVVDPHKHGLQPYGCGCVLFRDPGMGRWYKHDSPYTYFTSNELHLGEISLECSRAGASAVALWATQKLLPLVRGGAFAQGLEQGREAALRLYDFLAADGRFAMGPRPELDIVVWTVRPPQRVNRLSPAVGITTTTESSRWAQEIFDRAAEGGLHLALAHLPARFFPDANWSDAGDDGTVTSLRSVLMKPEHLDWVDEIGRRIGEAIGDEGQRVGGSG
ncbi:MAG TPA: aminotransferase class I/II-fold pyridoxal phosphate-dependent enzyme [Acidobacteriaceae bacterium]|jgi:glutamate/tyrosine decarboxylase-like PLP-dependent enzyme|nr:aminotransferase class I/II-fold pyridoxal phosphate-dependent enzyme [Acidobacteriaceae bacterium]